MQLFSLVNTLLAKDPETFKRHLTIQKYPVIPLSPQSGLLKWVSKRNAFGLVISLTKIQVPDTDTLHILIKEYREHRKILLNIEHRLMLQVRLVTTL